jgi:hypothetical protein
VALLLSLRAAAAAVPPERVIDDFETSTVWSRNASPGAVVEVAQDSGHDGMGMRIDFDFQGGAGFVFVRRELNLPLPANYAFSFDLRGDAQRNDFQFKLVDPSGHNVWWRRHPDYEFPSQWQRVVVRRSRVEYAWGPDPAPLKSVGAIEFAIATGQGGKGSIWIDNLRFEKRRAPMPDGRPPKVRASTSLDGHDPSLAVDGQHPETVWRSGSVADDQWMILDFGESREYGGLVIDWDAVDFATSYDVEASEDEKSWSVEYSSERGNGGRDYVYLPEGESRYLRIHMRRSSRAQGYGIASLMVKPFDFSASPNRFFGAMAQEGRPGLYPKYLYDKQTYWTVIGVEDDVQDSLMNEEGMIELGLGSFSLEPFLYVDGKLLTWQDVQREQQLQEGYLPIPSVQWRDTGLSLQITAFAAGKPGASALYARYRVRNDRQEHEHVSLFVTLRPFQVTPPWQSLNMSGGVSEIRKIAFAGDRVQVDDEWTVVCARPPARFGAVTFEGGPLTDVLERGEVPADISVHDAFGFAAGALRYDFELPPGAEDEVVLMVPYHGTNAVELPSGPDAQRRVGEIQERMAADWRSRLSRVEIELPPEAVKLVHTAKSSLAYALINRDGPALQPGSRNYARFWIRDGAMSSAALLDMGFTSEARAFLEWFVEFQEPSGRIPCCVDRRGADPVAEHDSHGQFIYAVGEYYRHTGDAGFVHDMWPYIVKAADYLNSLRMQRTTENYRTPELNAYFGLLPESISHEGYSARPVHSYWDNFFALRGFKDAATLAVVVGDADSANRFAALRDDFDRDLSASISKAMEQHKIDFIPGSVELGDFDPTSTTIALLPGGEFKAFQPALMRTFDRYYEYFTGRRDGRIESEAYTPYELRSVGALVRLGERQRALEVLDFLMQGQRPAAWNQWAEVVWRDRDLPRFIGDMPHTWVSSGFVRSLRVMLSYERDEDHALVLAAGVPASWLNGPGVGVKRLSTHFGVLHYNLRAAGDGRYVMRIDGDLRMPPGKIEVRPPLPRPIKAVSLNGVPLQGFAADAVTVGEFPADLVIEF